MSTPIKFTKENCLEKVLLCETRNDFWKNYRSYYDASKRYGWFEEICLHLKSNKTLDFTVEFAKKEVLKYKFRSELKRENKKLYDFCWRNGILDEVCSHMEYKNKKHSDYTYEYCFSISSKYKTRKKFQLNNKTVYEIARKNGWLDSICEHMVSKFKKWTVESAKITGLNYTSRKQFERENKSCYEFCYKNGILDEVCSHMEIKQWVNKHMVNFVSTLYNELNNLQSIELVSIINSNGLHWKLKKNNLYNDLISSKPNSEERKLILEKITETFNNDLEELPKENNTKDKVITKAISISEIENDVLNFDENYNDTFESYKMLDNQNFIKYFDNETLEFLLHNRVKILWNSILNNKHSIEEIFNEQGGKNFTYIKNVILNEYTELSKLSLPTDYIFNYQPNLMQKLTAYRLITNKSYGNWSGTGAGKTISALLSGRLANAKNTIIICNNSTVSGWEKTIKNVFKNSNVFINELKTTDLETFNYTIFNYEKFQLKDSEKLVTELLNSNIDYIIFDEVQNIKQRDNKTASIRKNNLLRLRIEAKKNPNLLTLVMTATPVINNLIEAKYLIELLTGCEQPNIKTEATITNGIKLYEYLTRFGLRYKPKYNILINEEILKTENYDLSESILNIGKGDILGLEKLLIHDKLNVVKHKITKGTLIYTHFVKDLKDIIGNFVSDLGFSYGFYTGDNKEGLEKFKNGEIDVLIGSLPISTGVDGIQYVCNNLIPICLCWTNADYEQLKGRMIRQGSNFTKVNIYIPQVYIGSWSFDNYRLNIIKHKGTLADLVVDGIIPNGVLPSKEKLVEDAKIELKKLLSL